MADDEQEGARMRVGKFLTEHGTITEKIAAEELGIIASSFRVAIYKLRLDGWNIKLERYPGKGSAYRLVSTSGNPVHIRTVRLRSYTTDEFRKMLVSLYGHMEDWQLASAAVRDFNSEHQRIHRWLTRGKPVTGPAVALADKLIAEHNAKTGMKP